MAFVGYVIRGSNGTMHNRIIEGCIDGKRDKGRRRRSWIDDLKNWARTKNFGALKRTAEDRVKWKLIVSNLRVEEGTK